MAHFVAVLRPNRLPTIIPSPQLLPVSTLPLHMNIVSRSRARLREMFLLLAAILVMLPSARAGLSDAALAIMEAQCELFESPPDWCDNVGEACTAYLTVFMCTDGEITDLYAFLSNVCGV